MRAVRNTVNTGRTVVCTIHQPSIDVFDAFDELLLLKRGGRTIYHGPLGRDSQHLISYFTTAVPAVDAPQDNTTNPSTWMLDISSVGSEARYGVEWADIYNSSELCRCGAGQGLWLTQEVNQAPRGNCFVVEDGRGQVGVGGCYFGPF